jgi:hypothetical protein
MRCLLISSLEAKPAQAQLLKQKERLRLAALSTFLGHAWLSLQTMTNLPFRSTVFLRHNDARRVLLGSPAQLFPQSHISAFDLQPFGDDFSRPHAVFLRAKRKAAEIPDLAYFSVLTARRRLLG